MISFLNRCTSTKPRVPSIRIELLRFRVRLRTIRHRCRRRADNLRCNLFRPAFAIVCVGHGIDIAQRPKDQIQRVRPSVHQDATAGHVKAQDRIGSGIGVEDGTFARLEPCNVAQRTRLDKCLGPTRDTQVAT